MQETPYEIAYQLKDLLKNDPRVILLEKLEQEMNNDEQVMALAYKKDLAASEYSDILKIFADDSDEVISKRKDLYEAKKNLESLPLVQEYLKAFQKVRELYEEINTVIFGDLKTSLCPKD